MEPLRDVGCISLVTEGPVAVPSDIRRKDSGPCIEETWKVVQVHPTLVHQDSCRESSGNTAVALPDNYVAAIFIDIPWDPREMWSLCTEPPTCEGEAIYSWWSPWIPKAPFTTLLCQCYTGLSIVVHALPQDDTTPSQAGQPPASRDCHEEAGGVTWSPQWIPVSYAKSTIVWDWHYCNSGQLTNCLELPWRIFVLCILLCYTIMVHSGHLHNSFLTVKVKQKYQD